VQRIKQLPMSCFLACLESFLADNSVKLTQQQMIDTLQPLQLCSADGVVNLGDEPKACEQLGIRLRDALYQYPVPKCYADGSLLIGTSMGGNHCVRFKKQTEPEKIIVMDPASGDFRYWDRVDLNSRGPVFHVIEYVPPPNAV
jgi:hypothetical protein